MVCPIFLYIFLLNLFLAFSLYSHSVPFVCVLQGQSASYWWDLDVGLWRLVRDPGVRPGEQAPQPVVLTVWVNGVTQCQLLERIGSSAHSHWGRSIVCSQTSWVRWRAGTSEVCAWFCTGSWNRAVKHSLCAWCWLLGGWVPLSSPNLVGGREGRTELCMCIHQQTPRWTSQHVQSSVGPEVQSRISGEWSVHAGTSSGIFKCGMHMGWVCESCMFAASTRWDRLMRRKLLKQLRGPGIWAGMLDGQMGHANTQGRVLYVCLH